MGKFFDYLIDKDCGDPPNSALLLVMGDRNIPLMDALLQVCVEQPNILDGLLNVMPVDGEPLHFSELRLCRPPYLRALRDISQFLWDNGYEAASSFLTCGLNPQAEVQKKKGQYILPIVGHTYYSREGKKYRCTGNVSYENDERMQKVLAMGKHRASLVRTEDGWHLTAHGVIQYVDGAIGWDYSTGGRFSC